MKLDIHVHTSEVSPCGVVTAKQTVSNYIMAGFDGIVITDHFRKSFFDENNTIDDFLKGYKIAKKEGEKSGLKVYLGAEIMLTEHPHNEYLLYGIDEKFLYDNPLLYEKTLDEVLSIVHEYDGIVIQAHPFRNEFCVPRSEVDGYEVFNGHFCHRNHNSKSLNLAKKMNKIMTAGSDAHWIYDTANGGIELDVLPHQKDLGSVIAKQQKLITTPVQHLKTAIITSADNLEKVMNEKGLDAIISLSPTPEIKTAIPVFTPEKSYEFYFKNNRYSIINNVSSSHPFDPSISFSKGLGTTSVVLGKELNVARDNGHYTISIPKGEFAIIEFWGYKPTL